MPLFKQITIVGVGLLGGSLGLAVRQKKLAHRVVGVFRRSSKIAAAKRRGCVDEGTTDLGEAVKGSDGVILCTPVCDIVEKLGALKKIAPRRLLITDVGSTKASIVRAASGLNFIGAHPIAGSEASGLRHARGDLFTGSVCVLVPGAFADHNSLARLRKFWQRLGARTVLMTADQHDRVLSLTSHLPHAMAYALINAIPADLMGFSAGGLKDTTRVALSEFFLWGDIFLTNKRHLLAALDRFEKSIQTFRRALIHNDRRKLLEWLEEAQQKRLTGFPHER